MVPVVAIVALFAFSNEGLGFLILLTLVSTIWILVAWRRGMRWRVFALGLAVCGIAFLGGLPALRHSFVGMHLFVGLIAFTPLMFHAGVLLTERTSLGKSQLGVGQFREAIRSFLWGCLAFIPMGLMNAMEGSPGTGITWVTHWWMPFSLPWFSGIAEETWFRLLLVGLLYLLLRPSLEKHAGVAVLLAVLSSALIFGLGHGRNLERLLSIGLLYGLPLAVIFVRRDWEHSVGAHYMINMGPWLMVYLES